MPYFFFGFILHAGTSFEITFGALMKKLFDLFKTYWYELVLFSTYGAAIFYIGGLNNDGWVRLAGVGGRLCFELSRNGD